MGSLRVRTPVGTGELLPEVEVEEGREGWSPKYAPGDSELASTWLISALDMLAAVKASRHASSRAFDVKN